MKSIVRIAIVNISNPCFPDMLTVNMYECRLKPIKVNKNDKCSKCNSNVATTL